MHHAVGTQKHANGRNICNEAKHDSGFEPGLCSSHTVQRHLPGEKRELQFSPPPLCMPGRGYVSPEDGLLLIFQNRCLLHGNPSLFERSSERKIIYWHTESSLKSFTRAFEKIHQRAAFKIRTKVTLVLLLQRSRGGEALMTLLNYLGNA